VVYAAGSISLDGGSLLTDPLTLLAGSDLSGSGLVSGNMTDDRTITASGGTLELTGGIGGSGTLDASGTLQLDGSVASGITVTFDPGALVLGEPLEMNATIEDFYSDGSINFAGNYGMVDGSFSGDVLTVYGDSTAIAELTFAPGYNDGNVGVSENDGTITVTANIPCFCRGTLIRTPSGDVPVEALAVGDRILTLSGEAQPIVWIGTGRVLVTAGRRCAAAPIIVRSCGTAARKLSNSTTSSSLLTACCWPTAHRQKVTVTMATVGCSRTPTAAGISRRSLRARRC
jgi:hypothetical protein